VDSVVQKLVDRVNMNEIPDKELERARARVKKIRAFYTTLLSYLFVNILLIIINLLTDPHDLWFFWVTLIWGAILIIQALNTFTIRDRFLGEEWEERKVNEILEKRRQRRDKE
jgi:two-component system LytT family sensor kinase